MHLKSQTKELIAKPPALPGTWAPDAHFSGIAILAATFPGGFAITSKKGGYLRAPVSLSCGA